MGRDLGFLVPAEHKLQSGWLSTVDIKFPKPTVFNLAHGI